MDKIEVTQADIELRKAILKCIVDALDRPCTDGDMIAYRTDNLDRIIASHRLATRTDATPVAFISAERLNRKREFEANGAVVYDRPLGTSTMPLYTHPPATDVAALVEAAKAFMGRVENSTWPDQSERQAHPNIATYVELSHPSRKARMMSDTIPKVKPSKIEEPAAWYAGTDEEYMSIGGPYKTREEAITEGRHDKQGKPFYICNAALYAWSAPDAESVIDGWVNDHDELWWEDGFSGFDATKDAEIAAQNDLQTVLNEWFERQRGILPTPTAFCIHTGGEWIDAPLPQPVEEPLP